MTEDMRSLEIFRYMIVGYHGNQSTTEIKIEIIDSFVFFSD